MSFAQSRSVDIQQRWWAISSGERAAEISLAQDGLRQLASSRHPRKLRSLRVVSHSVHGGLRRHIARGWPWYLVLRAAGWNDADWTALRANEPDSAIIILS
eukprot:6572054-Pyramimonas_sp.AAC.1